MQQHNVLEYRHYRYLKVSLLLIVLAVAGYALHHPAIEPYGGTWLGYVLGVTGFSMVGVLLWYGVRKRRIPIQAERRKPRESMLGGASAREGQERRTTRRRVKPVSTQQGWLSAHAYLGMTVLVIASLHSGLHFGWNVHTLSFLLLALVVATGLYGMYAYLRFPRLMTQNLGEDTLGALLLMIRDLDDQMFSRALKLPEAYREVVRLSIDRPHIGGSVREQLFPNQAGCKTAEAARRLQGMGRGVAPELIPVYRELYALLLRKQSLVRRARREIMLKARLQAWLYLHVPLAIALMVALTAHILAILFYW